MVSKTRMIDLVKAFDAPAVDAGLTASPDLLAWRGERGRTWLHLLCGVEITQERDAAASIETAKVLVRLGLGISDAAFTEGEWRATPVWFCISRGRNLPLATWLLERGADPNHSLFAAAWNNDLEAIRLLASHGAALDPVAEGETPFLGAVKWSRFEGALEMLRLGADPNFRDAKGMTALHYMLKKGSDARWIEAVIEAGARGDLEDAEGRTARRILSRKQDPALRRLAERLT